MIISDPPQDHTDPIGVRTQGEEGKRARGANPVGKSELR